MRRHSFTLLLTMLMMVFAVFFGIELATRGMAQIHHPAPTYAVTEAPPAEQTGGSAAPNRATGATGTTGMTDTTGAGTQSEAPPVEQPNKPQPQPILVDSGVNRLGNRIGDMLQAAAHGAIELVVSLFDGLVN